MHHAHNMHHYHDHDMTMPHAGCIGLVTLLFLVPHPSDVGLRDRVGGRAGTEREDDITARDTETSQQEQADV